LRELDVRYWMNPNQVYQSGLKSSQINLPDAKAICLMECPLPAEDGLNFVCDYPEGDIRLSVDDWIDRDYDYFEYLTPDMRNSSLQLQGPCYPVIFPSVNGESDTKIKLAICSSILPIMRKQAIGINLISFCHFSLLELPVYCTTIQCLIEALAADGWCQH
jgi:hypothetical protein